MKKINLFFIILFIIISHSFIHAADLEKPEECRPRKGLPNTALKMKKGGTINIAYLGGSITCQNGYRVYSLEWFRKNSKGKINEIFAGIGGTPSFLGVYRVKQDVLQYKPDLLFVEFAVNDSETRPVEIERSMEGIVRQTWKANPETDICFVYTIAKQEMFDKIQGGTFPRSVIAMERIAEHYGIPTIHMGIEIAKLEKNGKLVLKGKRPEKGTDAMKADPIVFSKDTVHPYIKTGHMLYMQALARSFPKLLRKGKKTAHKIISPLHENNRENASMVKLDNSFMSGDWTKLDSEKNPVAKKLKKFMPVMYMSDKPGAKISFKFKGTSVGFYDVLGPDCGQVIVRVDGKQTKVKSRFDRYSVYHRLSTLTLARDMKYGEHTIEVEIHPDEPDKKAILSKHPKNKSADTSEDKFKGRAWYVGAIMLNGEMIK
jgi:GDSL-like lipase/acylhydrolase family protein